MYIGYIKNNIGILHSITSKGINDITTSWLSWQSVAQDSRVVSSILTEGLGVAFFATSLGLVLENLHIHPQNILIVYLY